MNRWITLLILPFFFVSCKPETDYEKMEHYYNSFKDGELSQFQFVVVINEIGSCINCNNYFSKEMAKALDDDKILFILSGNGTRVDMSGYINEDYQNVIWDRPARFDELKIVERCAILELKNREIIDKEEINIDNMEETTTSFLQNSIRE